MNLIKFYQVFTFLQIYELLEYKCRENNFDGGVPVGTVHVSGKKKWYTISTSIIVVMIIIILVAIFSKYLLA